MARELAIELDGLALALEQAGANVWKRRITLAQYLAEWRAHRVSAHDWYDDRLMQYPRSVAVTWQTTLEQLSPLAVAELAGYSMVRWETDPGTVTVHRVVQEIVRTQLPAAQQPAWLTLALRLLYAATPGAPQDVRIWPEWTLLQPHVSQALTHAEALGVTTEPTARLLDELGRLLHARALYGQAEPLFRRALAITEASLGPDHPTVATDLNDLALLLQATNRLAEAEPLYRRALAIVLQFTQQTGHQHPNLQAALGNYAGMLHVQGRPEDEVDRMIRELLAEYGLSLGEPDGP